MTSRDAQATIIGTRLTAQVRNARKARRGREAQQKLDDMSRNVYVGHIIAGGSRPTVQVQGSHSNAKTLELFGAVGTVGIGDVVQVVVTDGRAQIVQRQGQSYING